LPRYQDPDEPYGDPNIIEAVNRMVRDGDDPDEILTAIDDYAKFSRDVDALGRKFGVEITDDVKTTTAALYGRSRDRSLHEEESERRDDRDLMAAFVDAVDGSETTGRESESERLYRTARTAELARLDQELSNGEAGDDDPYALGHDLRPSSEGERVAAMVEIVNAHTEDSSDD
jgi:hypothetical protein